MSKKLISEVDDWICYSETRKQKLNISDIITELSDNKLIIYTYSSKQSNFISEITLHLIINYNQNKKEIVRAFELSTSLADIKEFSLVVYDLLFEKNCNVQIKLFGQSQDEQNQAKKTLKQMFLKNYQALEIYLTFKQTNTKESELLNHLRSQKDQHQKLQQNIEKFIQNIKNKIDITLNHLLDESIQLLNNLGNIIDQIENNINMFQKQQLEESTKIFPLQICQITIQINEIHIFISQIQLMTNKYTTEALENSKELFHRYQKNYKLEINSDVTLLEILEYLKTDPVQTYQSKLRFSNKLINQINLNEIIQNLVDHIVYIDRLKIEIKQSGDIYHIDIFY